LTKFSAGYMHNILTKTNKDFRIWSRRKLKSNLYWQHWWSVAAQNIILLSTFCVD